METAELGPGDPDRIGPYQVTGVLGEGGMGKVYKGQAPGLQLVAVKVIRRDRSITPPSGVRKGPLMRPSPPQAREPQP